MGRTDARCGDKPREQFVDAVFVGPATERWPDRALLQQGLCRGVAVYVEGVAGGLGARPFRSVTGSSTFGSGTLTSGSAVESCARESAPTAGAESRAG